MADNQRLKQLASAPSSPTEGEVYYDTALHGAYVWNGTLWVPWGGSGGGGVTSVTGADTSIVIGGTSTAPTIRTATLDVIATDHPPVAAVGMNAQKITGLAAPTVGTDGANKDYVDATIFGLSPCPVDFATTAATPAYSGSGTGVLTFTATGIYQPDGTTVSAGQKVLLKNQASRQDNGVYAVTTAGAVGVATVLTRLTDVEGDAATWADMVGQFVIVGPVGTSNADTVWLSDATPGGTLNTTNLDYVKIQGFDAAGAAAAAQAAAEAACLAVPTGASDVTASRAVGTAYQPSATRPVLVVATLYAESGSGAPSAIGIKIGATSTPTTQIGQLYLLNNVSSAAIEVTSALSTIVPPGWYYEVVVLNSGLAQGISQVIEYTL